MAYKINYISSPFKSAVFQPLEDGKIYDPKRGVYTISEYEKKDIAVLSYV